MTKKEKADREREYFAMIKERERIWKLIEQAEARGVDVAAKLQEKLDAVEKERG